MLSNQDITATVLRERPSLVAYLATITRNYHLAEDVYQDVCVKAMGRADEFESIAHLLNWARLTGRNRAIDLLRSRDGKYEGLSEQVLEARASVWSDTQAQHVAERQDALAKCLDELTSNNREIVRLRYFEGRSGSEVANLLNRKLETVYQALARIHKLLGECVQRRVLEGDA